MRKLGDGCAVLRQFSASSLSWGMAWSGQGLARHPSLIRIGGGIRRRKSHRNQVLVKLPHCADARVDEPIFAPRHSHRISKNKYGGHSNI